MPFAHVIGVNEARIILRVLLLSNSSFSSVAWRQFIEDVWACFLFVCLFLLVAGLCVGFNKFLAFCSPFWGFVSFEAMEWGKDKFVKSLFCGSPHFWFLAIFFHSCLGFVSWPLFAVVGSVVFLLSVVVFLYFPVNVWISVCMAWPSWKWYCAGVCMTDIELVVRLRLTQHF